MILESEAEMGHHENLSSDGLEDSKGHAVANSGGRLRRIASVNQSLSPKFLGIFLVAQQFTTASAESMCHAFHSIEKKFDMIGLISVFATVAATDSMSYSALNDDWFYVTGHIGPGSLNVASMLFEATGSRLAHLLTVGGNKNAYQLLHLDCPDGLHYIGLKSNTDCPVGNAVGASIVREHRSLWSGQGQSILKNQGRDKVDAMSNLGRCNGRNAGREVKVFVLEVGRTKTKEEMMVLMNSSKGGAFLLGWLPLSLTVAIIASSCSCNEWFVAGLIALGTFGMMVGVFGLRLCQYKYSEPNLPEDAPAGDCLVVDNRDADTFHIIQGEEESIQALFQCKIHYQVSHGKYALFLAGSMLYIYVIASVLYLPNVSARGQIIFAMANFIGLVTDVFKALNNGNLGLAKKACEQFKVVARDTVVFRNRTAAVAFMAKHAKDPTVLKLKKLLPCEGPVWEKWWEVLAKCDGKPDDDATILSVDTTSEDKELLKTLIDDMIDGLMS